jgi:hypothetical protein
MWCLRCYEPIRQLTPRDRGEPTITFLRSSEDDAERSRWKAGVNTFGPFGRIVVTLLVLALAPWSTNPMTLLVVGPAWLIVAVLVLRGTWKKDDVLSTSYAEMGAKGRSTDLDDVVPVRHPIPRSTIVAYGVAGALLVAAAIGWALTGRDVHALSGLCGSIALLVLTVRWFLRP